MAVVQRLLSTLLFLAADELPRVTCATGVPRGAVPR